MAEHLAALQRFGNKMPFAESYAPRRCDHKYDLNRSAGNLMAESAKWDDYLREAFQKKTDAGPDEPQAEPEGCEGDDRPLGPHESET